MLYKNEADSTGSGLTLNSDQSAVKTTGQASNAAQYTGTAAGTADVLPAAMRSSFAVGVRSVS